MQRPLPLIAADSVSTARVASFRLLESLGSVGGVEAPSPGQMGDYAVGDISRLIDELMRNDPGIRGPPPTAAKTIESLAELVFEASTGAPSEKHRDVSAPDSTIKHFRFFLFSLFHQGRIRSAQFARMSLRQEPQNATSCRVVTYFTRTVLCRGSRQTTRVRVAAWHCPPRAELLLPPTKLASDDIKRSLAFGFLVHLVPTAIGRALVRVGST